jgi:hypothetical protein
VPDPAEISKRATTEGSWVAVNSSIQAAIRTPEYVAS